MSTQNKLTLINKFIAWLDWQGVKLTQDGNQVNVAGVAESFLLSDGQTNSTKEELELGEAMRKAHDPYYSLYEN